MSNDIAIASAIKRLAATIEEQMQSFTDTLLLQQWAQTPGVVGIFKVVDSATTPAVTPGSNKYPWVGAGVSDRGEHYFCRWSWDDFNTIVEEVAGNRRVRQVLISLSNFEDDGGVAPSLYINIGGMRQLYEWGATLDMGLKRHLLQGGAVHVQVVLSADSTHPRSRGHHSTAVAMSRGKRR